MAQAEVGALRVVLGMDIAQFSDGSKKAQDMLDRLASRIGITAGVASAAGTLIGNALTRAAEKMVDGIKSAVDATAEIADAADKFGISIKTISAIVTEGEVPIATLSASLDGLQQSIFKVASNDTASMAAQAFNAIGVSALDTSGHMRSVSAVINDVADKFATYHDGVAKNALATALFGEKGAELVTVLSKGSAGIRELADEAAKLGNGLDSQAGAAAQAFKATLTELGKSFDVLYRQIAIKILPVIKDFTTAFGDWMKGTVDVRPAADRIASGINAIYVAALETSAGVQRLGINLKAFWDSSVALFTDAEVSKIQQAAADAVKKIDDDLAARKKAIQDFAANPVAAGPADEKGQQEPPIIQHTQKLTEAQRELNKQIQDGVNLAKQSRDSYQVYVDSIKALDAAQQAGKISAEQYGQAQRQATLIAVNAYAGAASNIAGSLTQVFQKSKGVAIAAAMINSFQAASNALAQAPWPLNFAAAAAALAAGFAQVANIRRTTENSGGGGGGGSGGATTAPAGATQTPKSLRVEGINPSQFYSGSAVKGLVESINDYVRNGGVLVTA
jgi:hypothetical protein